MAKIREMSQITANNEEVLERISTVQHSVSLQVTKAQQNLLETSEILKKYHPDKGAKKELRNLDLSKIEVWTLICNSFLIYLISLFHKE